MRKVSPLRCQADGRALTFHLSQADGRALVCKSFSEQGGGVCVLTRHHTRSFDQQIHDNKRAEKDEQGDQPQVNIKFVGMWIRAGACVQSETRETPLGSSDMLLLSLFFLTLDGATDMARKRWRRHCAKEMAQT